ncbi:isochorismatase family protein [Enteractinococcus coprophilus]|uniref:Ureidoacrylate peracid hydrolase n=1 Tax=Enteractinococcus coprophilus TaxID=1027633 RepID=A0A543ANK0_9MICC|nr:isochorismatase family cysteine hydrolase [Enteractinococcus coprophilus]TQL74139.1 ureidoacrylate peracid hydrolase [Enteractinococcus coprophilus]
MWQFDVNSSALLVMDMQRDIVEDGRPMEVPMARRRLPQMRELVDGARAANVPIIYTQHVLYDQFNVSPLETSQNTRLLTEGMRDGTDGVEIVPQLGPQPTDHVVKKHRYDAFYNTNLEVLLHTRRGYRMVDTVVITGTLTEVSCDSTARSAFMRDFKVVFARDATAGACDTAQETTLNTIDTYFGRVLSNEQILQAFAGTLV